MLSWFTSNEPDPRYGESFQSEHSRRSFIRKVLSIVWIQLTISAAITSLFVFNEEANEWMRYEPMALILFITATVLFLIVEISIFCCMVCARTVPVNYILLFVGTFAQSFVVSFICSRYYTYQILFALLATVIIVTCLTLIALFAPCDFTGCGMFLVVIGLVLMIVGIASIFIREPILRWIFVTLGLLLFSLSLVYNLQALCRTDVGHQYDEEDYIVAALAIYIDIIYLFLLVLELIGLLDD